MENNNKGKEENLKHKKNFIAGVVLFLFNVFILIESIRMPRFDEHRSIYGAPGIVPGLLSSFMLVMSIILIIDGIKGEGHKNIKTKLNIDLNKSLMNNELIRLIVFVGLFSAYVFALLAFDSYYYVGVDVSFLFLTTIFLFISFKVFGWKNSFYGFLIAFSFSLGLELIFTNFFMIPLP